MSTVLVTGSAGLIGSEAVHHFARQGLHVIGIDNDMRKYFFGAEASTEWMSRRLQQSIPDYEHLAFDVRDYDELCRIFRRYGRDIALVIHAAAQPSHDWAAGDPITDFSINATATLNLLEATRTFSPDAPFIFTSTNKVYGDSPNALPLVEQEYRWEADASHPFAARGISEEMPVDRSLHSPFGASKLAADVMVQEYGQYYGLRTACFRAGCLTGANHSGAQLHGFLAYLMRCCVTGARYRVFGYKGKQVRDNMHSSDLVRAFDRFFRAPRAAEVYNIGGGRFSNCSMLEAISLCQEISGREMDWEYVTQSRIGDHIWWISDISKFQSHYPGYEVRLNTRTVLEDIYAENRLRWSRIARVVHA